MLKRLIPNIIYAVRDKQNETRKEPSLYLSVCEQVGRYACIVLMWLLLLDPDKVIDAAFNPASQFTEQSFSESMIHTMTNFKDIRNICLFQCVCQNN